MPSDHPLDHPARASLTGAHAQLAERCGRVLRYQDDVAPFVALPADPDEQDWTDLATLTGPGGIAVVSVPPPAGWVVERSLPLVQLVDDGMVTGPDAEAERLTPSDVPEMLSLVERTEPGPFRQRTIEMGTYLGIRRDGVLVAMAGERMHPPGWTEISAVCTDDAYRGQGLATRLMRAVADGIRARGETPFLHATATNTGALRLYESLGFRARVRSTLQVLRAPG